MHSLCGEQQEKQKKKRICWVYSCLLTHIVYIHMYCTHKWKTFLRIAANRSALSVFSFNAKKARFLRGPPAQGHPAPSFRPFFIGFVILRWSMQFLPIHASLRLERKLFLKDTRREPFLDRRETTTDDVDWIYQFLSRRYKKGFFPKRRVMARLLVQIAELRKKSFFSLSISFCLGDGKLFAFSILPFIDDRREPSR